MSEANIVDQQKLAAIRANIRHVFVLMLENRSFDHMFALSGIPGVAAATSENANSYNGKNYPFQGSAPDQMPAALITTVACTSRFSPVSVSHNATPQARPSCCNSCSART